MAEHLALGWRRTLAWARLGTLELRRSTGGKVLYLLGGVLAWFVMVALWNALGRDNPMEGSSVLNGVVALPTVLLALFLGSQVVAADQENRSLEVVFSLPGGRTAIWILRVGVVWLFCGAVVALLTVLSWVFVAPLALWATCLHGLFPVAWFVGLAFLLSVLFRSGTAAALTAGLVLLGVFVTQGAWDSGPLAVIYPFLNPFDPPEGALPHLWQREVVVNRLGVGLSAALFLIFGLVRMRRRERLL